MRAGLIVTGVLGLGIALTFGAALATASMYPSGATVRGWYDGSGVLDRGGLLRPLAAPRVSGTGNTWAPGGVAEPDQGPALPDAGSLESTIIAVAGGAIDPPSP